MNGFVTHVWDAREGRVQCRALDGGDWMAGKKHLNVRWNEALKQGEFTPHSTESIFGVLIDFGRPSSSILRTICVLAGTGRVTGNRACRSKPGTV